MAIGAKDDKNGKIEVWMNGWLRETAHPLVAADVQRVARLPGIDRIFVMPDTAADEMGIPNGIVLEADAERAFIYPAAVSDPNCGYLLAAVEPPGGPPEPSPDHRALGWRFIHRLLELGRDRPLFALDLEAALSGGAAYVDGELGELPLAAGAYREDDGHVPAGLEAVPFAFHNLLRERFFRHLNYGHFVELDLVDQIWSPSDLERLGLREGDLVLIVHDGSGRAGVEIFMHYHEAITLEAVREGWFSPDDAGTGMAGIPLASPLGGEYFLAVKAMENYAYARRRAALHYAVTALEDIWAGRPRVRILSDRPHNKLECRAAPEGRSVLVHRHGAQVVDTGLAVVCSRPAVPSVLVAGAAAGERAYCSHGAAASPYLRGEMSLEDWRRLSEAPETAVTNGQQCMWDALRERPMALHLSFQNVLDAVSSLEGRGVVRRAARLWPLYNVTGTPKLLEAEEETA